MSRTRPHLLYVAWPFPPSRSAGMYRTLATANRFAHAGWDVSVLTADRETFDRLTGSDPESESRIDPAISIVRTPFDTTRGEADLRNWSRWRITSPLGWSITRSWRERRSFPETLYGSWRAELMKHAEQIHATKPVSLTIGSANPNIDFLPGYLLFKQHGVPYVMDYRDTWHLDMYSGRRIGQRWHRAARWESRMLRRAHEVWFVNAEIRDWHTTEHPSIASKSHVVMNGFDQEFLDAGRTRVPDAASGLVFGYLGSLTGPVPLRESLLGWRMARSRSATLANASFVIRGRLGRSAEPEVALLELIEEFGKDGVSYQGPVSKTAVADSYSQFDALVLILGKSRYVTSGKVFEYAATGLPIASLHDPETASSSILREHPAWFPAARSSPEAMAEALEATAKKAATMSAEDYAGIREWAEHLSRVNQLDPRIRALRDFVCAS